MTGYALAFVVWHLLVLAILLELFVDVLGRLFPDMNRWGDR